MSFHNLLYLSVCLFYSVLWGYYRIISFRYILKPIPLLIHLLFHPSYYLVFFLLGDIFLLFNHNYPFLLGIISFSIGHFSYSFSYDTLSYCALSIFIIYCLYKIVYIKVNEVDAIVYVCIILWKVLETGKVGYIIFFISDILVIINVKLNNWVLEIIAINLYWYSIIGLTH